MLTLKYDPKDAEVADIKEQIKSLSLAYKSEELPAGATIELREDDKAWIGAKAIKRYLFDLQLELKKWWYCDC